MDTFLGVAIVFATLLGPVLAVYVTRRIDKDRAISARRLDVFRALMRTRRAGLLPDHVNALNLVEIEFHGVKPVLDTYRDLMRHINSGTPATEQWHSQHKSYLTKMLSAMATELGYKIEQLDVLEGGYYPSGWGQTDEQQMAMRLGLLELLTGKRTLPVHVSSEQVTPSSSTFQTMGEKLTAPPTQK